MGPNKVNEVVKNIDKVTSEGDVYLARESKWKRKPPEMVCKKGIVKFSRTPILKNISERLLLQITIYLYLIFP